jgi:hypothetical protein
MTEIGGLAVKSAAQSLVGHLLCLALSGNTLEMCIVAKLFVSNNKRCLFSGRAHFIGPLIESIPIPIRRWIPLPIYEALLLADAADNIDTS